MLDHFKEVKLGIKPKIKYKLKGFYQSGQSKLLLPLSLQNLKNDFLKLMNCSKNISYISLVKMHLYN